MHGKKSIMLAMLIFSAFSMAAYAQEGLEPGDCENVKYKSLCYTVAAESNSEQAICDNIQNEKVRENCIESASGLDTMFFVIPAAIIAMAVAVVGYLYFSERKSKYSKKPVYRYK